MTSAPVLLIPVFSLNIYPPKWSRQPCNFTLLCRKLCQNFLQFRPRQIWAHFRPNEDVPKDRTARRRTEKSKFKTFSPKITKRLLQINATMSIECCHDIVKVLMQSILWFKTQARLYFLPMDTYSLFTVTGSGRPNNFSLSLCLQPMS